MEKIVKKIKDYRYFIAFIFFVLGILWGIFKFVDGIEKNLKIIQKSTLRNTIWNIHIPLHDRLESCDSYLELGYNSETKKYCNELLNEVGDY